MVLKFGKSGISSGSTLRLTNTAHIKRNASQSCIYMHEIHDKTVDLKVAKFLDAASVCYSLNKKGRWKLPEIIEEKILSELSSSNVTVTLMKLHKIHRQNNCIGYFTNKGRVRSVVPKKTKYINRLSITNVNRKPFRNRRRRRHTEVDLDQNLADDHEIKYRIVYPTPSSSAVTYTNPQKIGHNVVLNEHNRSKSAVRSKSRKWRCIERDLRYELDYIDDDAFDVDSELDSAEEVPQTQRSSFSDYFESALSRPAEIKINTRRRPAKRSRKHETKPMLYYLESEVMDKEEEEVHWESSYSPPTTTECQPVDVLISNQETHPYHLKRKYGDKVTFAQCEPRTFIIDISAEVESCLKSSKSFKTVFVKKLELATFLVFSLKSSIEPDCGLWEVQVNLPTKLPSIRIGTLVDIKTLDVDEVISFTTRYLESIPDANFYRKDLLPLTKTPLEKLNTIDPLSQLKVGNYLPEDLSQTATAVPSIPDHDNLPVERIPSPMEEIVCNICYTDDSNFTSLRSCGHIFCNDCWKNHLLSSFVGKSKVVCPEYKCDQVVDAGTMLKLVNIRDIQRSHKKKMNTKVESSSCMKWCPNQNCERILHNDDSKADCVILCDCGLFVCFGCNDERHWPSSCDEYASYKNKLNAFGGDVLRDDFLEIPRLKVRGKPCPDCKTFIIKNRGCPNMVCPCGCSFCWSCLTPLRNQTTSHDNCYKKKESEGTKQHEFIHIDKKVVGNPMKSKLFTKAVEYRNMRREKHIKIIRCKTLDLKVRILKWMTKHDVRFVEFGLVSEQQFDKLFLDIFNVEMELNYLCEICLVILDAKSKVPNRVLPNLRSSFVCLESYGQNLNAILEDGDLKHIKDHRKLLAELISLRQAAKDAVASTVNVIRFFRKYESKQ